MERQASMPLTFSGFVPTVPVLINGRQIYMGLDTGAQAMVVSPDTAERLNLPRDPSLSTQVIGSNGTSAVGNVIIKKVEFAGESHEQVSVAAISLAMPFSDSPPKLAGLIGGDMLSRFDIDFDVPGRTLTFYRVTDCAKIIPPWNGPYTIVPMSVTGSRRLAVPVELDGHLLTAIFDTGAIGLFLAKSSAYRLGITADMLARDPSVAGTGVGNHMEKVPYHQFGQIKIGAETFRNPRAQIADFPANEAEMLIGESYMRARRFWISYRTQVLLVQSQGISRTPQ
jgi:predicted aspartyl protease